MNNFKKIGLVALVPIAALLLSGCGSQTNAPSSSTTTPVASTSQSATQSPDQTAASTASQEAASPTASQVQAQLQPLPADNKQAIDTQLDNIDKDMNATAATSTPSTDLSNANLGM